MAALKWDEVGERIYETGVSKGVLYVQDGTGAYQTGVAWNGLSAITESPSGADESAIYADDTKYLSLRSAEEFGATIEAYTYPDEWEACDGSAEISEGITIGQQTRSRFGLCYTTKIGSDTKGTDHGYKIHIIYGATASPSQKNYQTVNDNPEAMTLSWEITTTPVSVANHKPTACITIDSTKVPEAKMKLITDKLFGTTDTDPALPTPDALLTLISA